MLRTSQCFFPFFSDMIWSIRRMLLQKKETLAQPTHLVNPPFTFAAFNVCKFFVALFARVTLNVCIKKQGILSRGQAHFAYLKVKSFDELSATSIWNIFVWIGKHSKLDTSARIKNTFFLIEYGNTFFQFDLAIKPK